MRTTILLLLFALACNDADLDVDGADLPDANIPDATDAHAPDADLDPSPDALPPLEWVPCAMLTGERDQGFDCLDVEVPLRRDVPDAPSIDLFVKRVRTGPPDGRSVWLLSGGPGQGGDGFEQFALQLTDLEPGLTIYMPDHRGTGRSTRWGCLDGEAPDSPGGATIVDEEWPGCHAAAVETYGEDGLRGFSTTEAALDLAWLIERSPEQSAYVFGVSYGTFLAHRYLQLAPDQAAGVAFDSSCSPGVCHLSAQDLWEDRVGRAWFDEVCAADETCREKLGPVPSEAIADLHAELADGHCRLLGFTPEQRRANLRGVLAQLMLIAGLRPALPAFVYRMTRCDEGDRRAIAHMLDVVFGGGVQPESYSWLLGMNIMVSELWEPSDPSPDELAARYEDTLMCRGVSNLVANQAPVWTRYAEPLLAQPVESETPTLMIQAEYDPATPVDIAQPMSDALAGDHHRFVVVKHASHTVVSQSPLAEDPTQQCGLSLLRAFIADPSGPLPDCADATLPPDFQGSPGFAEAIYGTQDLWENP